MEADYAAGVRWKKKTTDGAIITEKYYLQNIEYNGTNLEAIYHSDGRAIPVSTTYEYQYTIKDHLGNSRVMFKMVGSVATLIQENHYYPFGLEMEGAFTGSTNKYRYNGKELHDDFGLNLYDYGARWYDPSVGRFTGVDLLADHPNQVGKSPYAYAWNNPIKLTDPDGNCPQCLPGFLIGVVVDASIQIAQNKFAGKGAFEDFSISSAIISGLAGAASGGTTSIARGLAVGTVESISKQVVTDEGINTDLSMTQTVSDVALGALGGKVKVFDDANITVKENALDRTQRIAKNDPASTGRAQNVVDAKSTLNSSKHTNQFAQNAVGNTAQEVSNQVRTQLGSIGDAGILLPPAAQMAQDNTRVVIPGMYPKRRN